MAVQARWLAWTRGLAWITLTCIPKIWAEGAWQGIRCPQSPSEAWTGCFDRDFLQAVCSSWWRSAITFEGQAPGLGCAEWVATSPGTCSCSSSIGHCRTTSSSSKSSQSTPQGFRQSPQIAVGYWQFEGPMDCFPAETATGLHTAEGSACHGFECYAESPSTCAGRGKCLPRGAQGSHSEHAWPHCPGKPCVLGPGSPFLVNWGRSGTSRCGGLGYSFKGFSGDCWGFFVVAFHLHARLCGSHCSEDGAWGGSEAFKPASRLLWKQGHVSFWGPSQTSSSTGWMPRIRILLPQVCMAKCVDQWNLRPQKCLFPYPHPVEAMAYHTRLQILHP